MYVTLEMRLMHHAESHSPEKNTSHTPSCKRAAVVPRNTSAIARRGPAVAELAARTVATAPGLSGAACNQR
jgi:hypothetical protein